MHDSNLNEQSSSAFCSIKKCEDKEEKNIIIFSRKGPACQASLRSQSGLYVLQLERSLITDSLGTIATGKRMALQVGQNLIMWRPLWTVMDDHRDVKTNTTGMSTHSP